MEDFTIQDKFISYTSGGGSNLKMCHDALEGKVTNNKIYHTQQTMFRQDSFSHALQVACKAKVLDCKYEDDKGTITMCVATVQKIIMNFVTWTKKSSLF